MLNYNKIQSIRLTVILLWVAIFGISDTIISKFYNKNIS